MNMGQLITYKQHFIVQTNPATSIYQQCTSSKDGHRITRWVDEDLLDEIERRARGDPEKMKLRKRLVEHPFGTIKHHWDQGHFLMRKLPNVGAETPALEAQVQV
jgi:hypothetical protein